MRSKIPPILAATAAVGIAAAAAGLSGSITGFGQDQPGCAAEPHGQPRGLDNQNGVAAESRGGRAAAAETVLRELRSDRSRRAEAAARTRQRADADGDPRDALLISFDEPRTEEELRDLARELQLTIQSVIVGLPAGTDYITTNLTMNGPIGSVAATQELRGAYRAGLQQSLDSSRKRQRSQFHEAQDAFEMNLEAGLENLDAGGALRIIAVTADGPDGAGDAAADREDMITARRDVDCPEARHLTPDQDLVFIAEKTRQSFEQDPSASPLPAPGESQ